MILSKKDLVLVKHDDKTERVLLSLTQKRLVSIVKEWFDVPELMPRRSRSTLEDYTAPDLLKHQIVKRMLLKDWPKGFYAIQLAHIDLHRLIKNNHAKKWNVARLLKERGDLRLDLEASEVQSHLERYLSQFYECYFCTIKDKNTGLYWMRVQLEQGLTFSIRSARTYKGYIVYVPKSEFLLIAGNSTRDTDNDIKEAILRTFKADSIMFQYVRDKAVEHFRNFTRVRQEGGVFAQLRKNQVDANPLDIRQSSKTKDWDDKFVEEGEQTRRIKPIEDKKLVARFDVLKNEFGWNSMAATNRLDVDLDLPFQPVAGQTQSDLANVKFELNLRGKHVPMGIKFMVEKGLVEMPAPEWLTSVPSTNATYFHVTKDGASQTKPNQNAEDEEMEEQEETQDVESQAASDSE